MKFIKGDEYYLKIKSKEGSKTVISRYVCKGVVKQLLGTQVDVVIMKAKENEPSTKFTLNREDCLRLHLKYEPGLQVMSSRLNWICGIKFSQKKPLTKKQIKKQKKNAENDLSQTITATEENVEKERFDWTDSIINRTTGEPYSCEEYTNMRRKTLYEPYNKEYISNSYPNNRLWEEISNSNPSNRLWEEETLYSHFGSPYRGF